MSLIEESGEKIFWLWRSQEIIKEILVDRKLPKIEPMPFSKFVEWVGEFETEELLKEAMEMVVGEEKNKTMIFWSLKPKLGTNIRDMKIKMETEEAKKAIVICDDSVTTNSKKIINDLRYQGVFVDVYSLDEMQINISKHRLVPKHEICSSKKKKELMRSYSLTATQIPRISHADPMVRHLRAVKGQLIKITRPSETQYDKMFITYRIVS